MEPISRFEIREELRRVLESRQFARAKKRSRFLEFVCEQSLAGNSEKVSEYLIGVEVYDRGTEFDPQQDAIVRVQACEIRRALKEYYAEDGKANPWRIDLPAGHYVPSFVRAAVPAPPTPVSIQAPPVLAAAPGFLRRHVPTLALGVVCVLLGALWIREKGIMRQAPGPTVAAAPPPSVEWFWKPFLRPAADPLVVLPNHPLLRAAHEGDTAATLKQGHRIEKSKIPEFRDTMHFRELRGFFFVPDTADFTGIGEALGLLDLFEFFSTTGQKVRLKPARLVDFEALKRGNAILLGGNQSWSGRIFLYSEGFWFHAGVITNKTPRAGEQAVYRPEFDPVTNSLRRDYALILMLPNDNPEQRILLVYGIYTQGTQAAMEYVTNPGHLGDLKKQLLALAPDRTTLPRFFQVLITTTVENDVPGKTSFVAARVIPD